jgi:hypothetical protein
MQYSLMGIVIEKRDSKAPDVQEVLTKYGCIINARIGIHEGDDVCSNTGFIILKLLGNDDKINELQEELCNIDGVRAKSVKI